MEKQGLKNIKYKKNFLEKVIVRFDFVNEILEIKNKLNEELVRAMKETLPIIEVRTLNNNELQLGNTGISSRLVGTESEWNFLDHNKENRIAISAGCLLLECSKYHSYESFIELFKKVVDSFFLAYKDVSVKRVGLRYINNMKTGAIPQPVAWDGYINVKYRNILEIFEKNEYMRAMSVLDIDKEDYKLRVQYGVYNQDYPALPVKKEFIIDIDAYSMGLILQSEYEALLSKMHTEIHTIFESFLEEGMRGVLNE